MPVKCWMILFLTIFKIVLINNRRRKFCTTLLASEKSAIIYIFVRIWCAS